MDIVTPSIQDQFCHQLEHREARTSLAKKIKLHEKGSLIKPQKTQNKVMNITKNKKSKNTCSEEVSTKNIQSQKSMMKNLGIQAMLEEYVGKSSKRQLNSNIHSDYSHQAKYKTDTKPYFSKVKSYKQTHLHEQKIARTYKSQHLSKSHKTVSRKGNSHSQAAVVQLNPKDLLFRKLCHQRQKATAQRDESQRVTQVQAHSTKNADLNILGCIARRMRKFQNQTFKNSPKNSMRLADDISHCEPTIQKPIHSEIIPDFLSIDTNYYGFSFKNQIQISNPKVIQRIEQRKCQQSKLQSSKMGGHRVKTSMEKAENDQQNLRNSLQVQRGSVLQENKTQQKSYAHRRKNLSKDKVNSTLKSTWAESDPLKMNKNSKTLQIAKTEKVKKQPLPGKGSANLLKTLNCAKSSQKISPKMKQVLLKERYSVINSIGRGLSGEVFKAKDVLADRFVALKVITRPQLYERQYNFYRELTHDNIVQYYNSFEQDGKKYLVLQYFPLTLRDLARGKKVKRKLEVSIIRQIFKGVVEGLSYLHSFSIAHRDIKLDNIVVTDDLQVAKFIDFGLCIDLTQGETMESNAFCGTLSYLAPQILQGKPHHPKQADIWALGVLLYGLTVQRMPFKANNEIELLNKIMSKPSKLIFPEHFNPELKELIEMMLERNPSQRPTISAVSSSQWLNSQC